MVVTMSDVIAVIAIFATIAVAAIGLFDRRADRRQTLELSREARDHERALARESRLQDRRAQTYEEMLLVAYRAQDVIDETMPVLRLSSAPPPPEPPSIEEQRVMLAKVAVYGSPEVLNRLRAFSSATREFGRAVWYMQTLHPDTSMPPVGSADDLMQAHRDLEAARFNVRSALDELERTAREELAA